MTTDGPNDPALERRLGAELRRHMAEAEREAQTLAAKRRALSDVARGAVDRGDAVTVSAGGVEFSGMGVYARGDLMTLSSQSAIVEVHISVIDWLRIDARARAGGRSSPVEAESFTARLGLLELTGESVMLLGSAVRVEGRIAAVARDHVQVVAADGKDWFLPMAAVAFVVRSKND